LYSCFYLNRTSTIELKVRDNQLFLKEEAPIQGAPVISLPSSEKCIPQHYLQFKHTYESVSELIKRISFAQNYKIHVGRSDHNIYIQVEIISHENYDRGDKKRELKKVYGRKWRVEKNLPTSEILQTCYLALEKAREHELRELLTIKDKDNCKSSAALSNHIDLPLIVREYSRLINTNSKENQAPIKQEIE